jgi:hypothetical protein
VAFAITLVSAVSSALPVEAQNKIARIGYLAADLKADSHRAEAFRTGLRDLGYVEHQNIIIEYRSAEGHLERLPTLAAELVRLKVDVLVTMRLGAGSSPLWRGRAATSRVCPSWAPRQSRNVCSCSRRPFRQSLGSRFSRIPATQAKPRASSS